MTEVAEPTEKVKYVRFTVEGAFLADMARTRLEEGAWDHGLRILSTLEGLTTDQAIAILKGEATLTRDSSHPKGIGYKKLKADGPIATRMRERMQYMYGDIFRYGNKLWRPYAYVCGWDRNDWHFAIKMDAPYNVLEHAHHTQSVLGGRDRPAMKFRSLFYAKDPHKDLLMILEPRVIGGNTDVYTGDVLCEQVYDNVPFWFDVPTNEPVKSVEAILARRRLPVWGAFEGITHTVDKADEPDVKDDVNEAVADADRMPHPAAVDEPEKKMDKAQRLALWTEIVDGSEKYLASLSNDELNDEVMTELREMSKIFEKGVDVLHSTIPADDWDRVDAVRKAFRRKREWFMGNKVIAQAEQHGGFYDLPLFEDGYSGEKPYAPMPFLRVPKNPFMLWCLRFIDFEAHGHEKPVWEPVAGSGWKMVNDDMYHTDWMLGARVPLDETYHQDDGTFGDVVRKSSFSHRDVINKMITGHQFTVLAKGDQTYISGEVYLPGPNERVPTGSIAVVPHAGPEYQLAMECANMQSPDGGRGCVICDVGGKLAHLVVVGREYKATILMMPGATKTYRKGERVRIHVQEGTIENFLL